MRASSVENESPLPLDLWMIRAQGEPQQASEEAKQGQVCLGVGAVGLVPGFVQSAAHGSARAVLTPSTNHQPLGTEGLQPTQIHKLHPTLS